MLADRIAVMRSGYCEQIGTGAEIYHHPATRFVADFIGETNWFSGVFDNGAGIIMRDGTRLKTTFAQGVANNTRVALGVRPERIRILTDGEPCRADENRISATISKIVFQGSSLRIEGRTSWGDSIELMQQTGSDAAALAAAESGKSAALAWEVSATLLFQSSDELSTS